MPSANQIRGHLVYFIQVGSYRKIKVESYSQNRIRLLIGPFINCYFKPRVAGPSVRNGPVRWSGFLVRGFFRSGTWSGFWSGHKLVRSGSGFLVRIFSWSDPDTDFCTGPRNPDQEIRITYRTKFMSGPNSGPRTGPPNTDQKIRTTLKNPDRSGFLVRSGRP